MKTKDELRELEIMAAVDGEEGFGGAEVTADELQSETAKTFVRTGVLLRRLGTAILNEPVPQSLIDIVRKKRDV
tara:strand:+ start:195 stop:416 length:222 start_codon:yes stop_codon:yes gene_type:complete